MMVENGYSPKLALYIESLIEEAHLIPEERQNSLLQLSQYIQQSKSAKLNFICTHNSRRSQIAQVWATVAADYYGFKNVEAYSGGTEVTAFNTRAVAGLERSGFSISSDKGENPHYEITYSSDRPAIICYSKKYDAPENPSVLFAAIMTCSDADRNCPFIPGATMRLPLKYEDPKVYDDTPQEASCYDERIRQIGREVFYAFNAVAM